MKNWRTTLAGYAVSLPFLIDALIQAFNSGYFTEKTGWQLFASIGAIVLATLAKDHNVTGGKNAVADDGPGGSNDPKPDPDDK